MTDDRPSFIAELKRRRVIRVAIVYVVAGWGFLQAADLIFPRVGLPDWTVTAAVVVTLLGFPVALALAWAFDIGPAGIVRDQGWKRSAGAQPRRAAMAWAGLGAVVAIVCIGAATSIGPHVWRRGARTASADVVAVFPFAIRGNPELDYLGAGMVNLLGTKLDGAGSIRVVDSRALLSRVGEKNAPEDPEVAAATALQFGAGRVVMGDLVQGGDRVRLTATLYQIERTGPRRLAQGQVEGRADDVFALVDSVAAQLLADIEGGTRVQRIAAVTTGSIDAYKAYIEGDVAFRTGRYADAIGALQRAVAIDSTFALAWYRLSLADEYRAFTGESREAASRALANAGRLSERDHRMLTAFVAWREGDSDRAERLYREQVARYPDDVEAWFELGEVLFHLNPMRGRSYLEAEEPFRKVLSYEPTHVGAMIHLARIAYARQDLGAMDSFVAGIDSVQGGDRTLENLALRAFAHGDSAGIADVLRRLDAASDEDVAFTLWVVGSYGTGLDAARAVTEVMTRPGKSTQMRGLGLVVRAWLDAGQGRFRDADRSLRAAGAVDPTIALEYRGALMLAPFAPTTRDELLGLRDDLRAEDAAMLNARSVSRNASFAELDDLHPLIRDFLLGAVAARLGDRPGMDSALARVRAFDGVLPNPTLRDDLVAYVRALAAMRDGRDADALAALRRATFAATPGLTGSPFMNQVVSRFTLAELLHRAGADAAALPIYENIVGTSTVELAFLGVAHLRQAEIHEKLGHRDEAIRHYRAFLELWPDPDAELRPLRDQATAALARLGVAA